MSYGEYILRTGKGVVGDYELVMGRFLYEREFLRRRPLLDLAPGRCWFARQAAEDICALDLAPEVVEHYAQQGINIKQGSAEAIPYPNDFFEGVFCSWLFEHLADPNIAMREIYRVLKPGGLCFLLVPSQHQLAAGFWDDYTHVRPYTLASLQHLAHNNGFSEARTEYLAYTRFGIRLLPLIGPGKTLAYMRFCDRALRKIGIVNKNNVTLHCRKPTN